MTTRRPGPKLVRLKTPKGDPGMCDTLLWLLNYARQGKIEAFSICLIGQREDGSEFSLESAWAGGDDKRELELLGCMRGAEHGLWERRQQRQES